MAFIFNKVISQEVDMAGKIRVMVSIMDGKVDEWLMFKFQTKPTDAMIKAEAEKQIYILNNPPAKEPTVEELKAVIVEKDALIASKDAQIATLSAIKVVK